MGGKAALDAAFAAPTGAGAFAETRGNAEAEDACDCPNNGFDIDDAACGIFPNENAEPEDEAAVDPPNIEPIENELFPEDEKLDCVPKMFELFCVAAVAPPNGCGAFAEIGGYAEELFAVCDFAEAAPTGAGAGG